MGRKIFLGVVAVLIMIGLCAQPVWAGPIIGEDDPLPGEVARVRREAHVFLSPYPDGKATILAKGTVIQFEVRQFGKNRVYRLDGRLPARVVIRWLNGLWVPKPFSSPIWVETWQIEAGVFDLDRPTQQPPTEDLILA